MTKYRIIGNMTGNSMDAIDLVLTEFDGDIMKDICAYTKPYSKDMQNKVESLRIKAFNKTSAEIETLPEFTSVHDEYIRQIAECINEMCEKYDIDKNNIDDCINEFERMISDKHDGSTPIFNYDKLWQEAKEIYDILVNIKNS